MNIILDLPPEITDPKTWIGMDLEIFTQKGDLNHLHRPSTGKFACLQVAIDDDVYVITNESQVSETLRRIQPATWVLQNGKFDFTHLRRWAKVEPRKKYWDTMTIERILWGGYYTHFGLNHLVRRYLGEYMSKETRETFEGATELTREQIEYAALDAYDTLRVAKEQRKLVTDKDFYIWSMIDRPATWAFLDFRGFAIDVPAWIALADEHKRLQLEADSRLYPLNPRSPKQVSDFLRRAGIKIKNTRADTLEEVLDRLDDDENTVYDDSYKDTIRDVLLSRTYAKRASTYGMKFVEDYVEYDDGVSVVYSDYNVVGAETGRTSSSNINMQNIPSRDTDAFRRCFVARPGHKLVIADFSSQEPRLTAVQANEQKLIEWIRGRKDIYIEAAKEVFGMEITKASPERKHMKSIILGGNYGMTEHGLAKRLNVTVDEAKALLRKFRRVLPDLARYMDEQREKREIVYTPFGRRIWLNPYSDQCERNALNGPTQGGAGDQMKAGMGVLHQGWVKHSFMDFPVVAMVHDELVSDCDASTVEDDAQFIKHTLEKVATDMVNGVVPFEVDVHIGDSWAEKG